MFCFQQKNVSNNMSGERYQSKTSALLLLADISMYWFKLSAICSTALLIGNKDTLTCRQEDQLDLHLV